MQQQARYTPPVNNFHFKFKVENGLSLMKDDFLKSDFGKGVKIVSQNNFGLYYRKDATSLIIVSDKTSQEPLTNEEINIQKEAFNKLLTWLQEAGLGYQATLGDQLYKP